MTVEQTAIDTLVLATALLLLAAAAAKVTNLAAFRLTLETYGVRRTLLIRGAAVAVPVAECASAALALVDVRAAAAAMGGLLLIFTAAAIIARRRGARPDCGCFDPVASGSLGVWAIARNGVLLGVCAAGLTVGDGQVGWSLGLVTGASALAACVLVLEAVRGTLEATYQPANHSPSLRASTGPA